MRRLFGLNYICYAILIFLMGSQVIAKSKIQNLTSEEKANKASRISASKTKPNQINSLYRSNLKIHSLGLGLGQTFLRGDFDRQGDDKITWDVYYSYSASFSFDMIANLHYSSHKFRGQKVKIQGATFGIKSKFFIFDEFSPFLMGGLGFYYPKTTRYSEGRLIESSGKTTFGYHIGTGVELRLNKNFVMGMLAHFHDPFDVKQDYGPEVEGSYAKLLLTVLYSFQ